jgi:hypothetical protein
VGMMTHVRLARRHDAGSYSMTPELLELVMEEAGI